MHAQHTTLVCGHARFRGFGQKKLHLRRPVPARIMALSKIPQTCSTLCSYVYRPEAPVIPSKLMLRNFMCYRDDLPVLDFDGISIACLSGENGSGKSALLDAMTWALWGEARLKSDDELIAMGAQEMEVDLIFALDGQDYRVIRKRNKGKRGQSWLDFQMRHNGSWKALSAATLRETQQAIVGTLRMNYDIFANSDYLRQGHADEFTR